MNRFAALKTNRDEPVQKINSRFGDLKKDENT